MKVNSQALEYLIGQLYSYINQVKEESYTLSDEDVKNIESTKALLSDVIANFDEYTQNQIQNDDLNTTLNNLANQYIINNLADGYVSRADFEAVIQSICDSIKEIHDVIDAYHDSDDSTNVETDGDGNIKWQYDGSLSVSE